MTDEQIKKLAEYLSGWLSAKHSIGLGMPSTSKPEADAFFGLREAFGVRGWVTVEEAEQMIRRAIE